MAQAAATPDGDRDPARMAQARTQLVSVAQWLARVERSFAAGAPGEELSLRWRGDRCAIATHDLGQAAGREVGLELKIDGLALQFTEAGRPSDHEIDVEERSPAHVEAWILIELLHRGLDRDRFSKDLPYDTSALLSGDGVEFSPGEYEAELRALAGLFRLATAALGRAAGEGGGEASATIAPRDLRVEATAKGRAIGFSLGDEAIAEPYFYVAGDAAARDPAAAAVAILPVSQVASEDEVDAFLAANLAPTRH